MQTRFGFTHFSVDEFESWIAARSVSRTIRVIQEHHTWRPNYSVFSGSNHFDLQKGMKAHHVSVNGWNDIGQHLTIFPDGTVMTGRSLESSPACILNRNSGAVCIENLGDFDTGRDQMREAQRNSIVRVTAALFRRFLSGAPNTDNIVYHHWFDLETGDRTDGGGNTKSCPGTAFFGGNTVAACRTNFLPLVVQRLAGGAGPAPVTIDKYVCVNADTLTVRSGPSSSHPVAPDRGPVTLGSILRVYREEANWQKISNSKEYWVSGARTVDVRRAEVNTDETNVRIGPAASFDIIGVFNRGQEVFVFEQRDGWSRIALDDRWIKSSLLT